MIPRARGVRRRRSGRARARSRSTSSKRSAPTSSAASSRVMFSSWPVCAFVAGVKIGSGSCSDSTSPAGSACPQTAPVGPVVLPARAGEVAAHDALDRQHLEPPALGRAPVAPERRAGGSGRSRRVRANQNADRPGEHAALVRDLGRQHDVEGRDAVARDEQQPLVVERVELADLAAPDVRRRPQAWTGSSFRTSACRRSKTVSTWRVYGSSEKTSSRSIEPGGDLRVGADELAEVALLVPRAHARAAARAGTPRRARARARRARAAAAG